MSDRLIHALETVQTIAGCLERTLKVADELGANLECENELQEIVGQISEAIRELQEPAGGVERENHADLKWHQGRVI